MAATGEKPKDSRWKSVWLVEQVFEWGPSLLAVGLAFLWRRDPIADWAIALAVAGGGLLAVLGYRLLRPRRSLSVSDRALWWSFTFRQDREGGHQRLANDVVADLRLTAREGSVLVPRTVLRVR